MAVHTVSPGCSGDVIGDEVGDTGDEVGDDTGDEFGGGAEHDDASMVSC